MTEEKKQRFKYLADEAMCELSNDERIELTNLAAELLLEIPEEQRFEQYAKVMRKIVKQIPELRG